MVAQKNFRVDSFVASLAIKAPCRVVTNANLTLSGEQTVNSVAVVAGDRVLVKDQTDPIENGIYNVETSAWQRSGDFDGNRDVARGTLVTVLATTGQDFFYQVQTADPIVIGISAITFLLVNDPNVSFPITGDEISAGLTTSDITDSIDQPNVKRYGTVGDGVADDTIALNNAIKVAVAGGPKTIFLPDGTYLVSATIEPASELFGLILQGDGSLSTIIKGSHSEGPVIHLNRSNSGLRGLTIDATTARNTGLATSTGGTYKDNVGVLFEAADTIGKVVASSFSDDLRILNQPSHGFLHIGGSQASHHNNLLVQDNLGHGAVFDQGTINSRTNKADPGIVTFTNFWALNNGGNGLVGGNPSDATLLGSFRFLFINPEFTGNATDATVRHSNDQVWLAGENHTILSPAFGGGSSSGAMRFAGKDLIILNPRVVSCTDSLSIGPHPVLDLSTGVTIENLRVLNDAQDPAIIIEDIAKVKDVRVTLANTGNVTSAFTDGAIACTMAANGVPVTIRRKASDQTVNNSTTLVNDSELAIPLAASETVSFEAMLRHVGNATADIKITFTAPTGATIRWQPEGSVFVAANDTVAIKSGDQNEGLTLNFGANTGTRILKLVGHVVMSTTSGKLQLQWAQDVATVVDTKILAGSTLRVFRDND